VKSHVPRSTEGYHNRPRCAPEMLLTANGERNHGRDGITCLGWIVPVAEKDGAVTGRSEVGWATSRKG